MKIFLIRRLLNGPVSDLKDFISHTINIAFNNVGEKLVSVRRDLRQEIREEFRETTQMVVAEARADIIAAIEAVQGHVTGAGRDKIEALKAGILKDMDPTLVILLPVLRQKLAERIATSDSKLIGQGRDLISLVNTLRASDAEAILNAAVDKAIEIIQKQR